MSDNLLRLALVPLGVMLFLAGVKLLAWIIYRFLPPGRLRTRLFQVRYASYSWLRPRR